MPARKRDFAQLEEQHVDREPPRLLSRVRNSWEFACLMQFIHLFGTALKIDNDLDVEVLEEECLKPQPSEKLSDLGLALLKFVSSHRGLTVQIFDEYTRRQYLAKAPQRNPFGDEEEPLKFVEFDVITKLRVLHQLSVWTLWNPDRIRERMEEKESAQTVWRIEPTGWDAQDRTYFVLDDNRLYRKTDAPAPVSTPKPKAKPKSRRPASRRSSKRTRLSNGNATTPEEEGPTELDENVQDGSRRGDDGLGGAMWECVAVSHEDYISFLESIRRSRDPDEKALFKRVSDSVMPEIERVAEAKERRAAKKQRELEALSKLATAKRSSRLADKSQKQRELDEAAEAERKREADLTMARREQERQDKMEQARESRMMTREQRLKDREVKRILHEEQLAKLESGSGSENGTERLSERNRKLELERAKSELEKLNQGEEDWDFDCAVCGVHGRNLDDGTHSLACDSCGVWQHSACHGINEAEAEREDFHFRCASCRKPKKPLKLTFDSPSDTNGHAMSDTIEVRPILPQASAQAQAFSPTPYQTSSQPQPTQVLGHSQTLAPPPLQALSAQGQHDSMPAFTNGSTITPTHSQATSSFEANPPPQFSTPNHSHNPFLNHFSRQQVVPSPKVAPSPAPSLSATQGATDIRFSPSHQSGGGFGMNINSHSPASSRPNAGAHSPTKQMSSPPRPALAPSPHASPMAGPPNGTTSFPPSPHNAAGAALSGISPIKHEAPRSRSPIDTIAGVATVTPSSGAPKMELPNIPALSPSVNAKDQLVEPPTKKLTPEKMTALPGPLSFAPEQLTSSQSQAFSDGGSRMDTS